MGQKVNPNVIRLGYTTEWISRWCVSKKEFPVTLHADWKVRQHIYKTLPQAGISKVYIDRLAHNVRVVIYASRSGPIIGRNGKEIEGLRHALHRILAEPVQVTVEEITQPELDAELVAESIVKQIKQHVMFRRAMKRAVTAALRAGALGVKVSMSGRLGGAEIARTEWYREGRVPLQVFRANIDYALREAMTTYGVIGVKVWIFKGELLEEKVTKTEAQ